MSKCIKLLVILSIYFAIPCASIHAEPPGGGWDLVFSDEFDGTTLDTDKWEPSWFTGNSISPPINSTRFSESKPVSANLW